MSKISSRLIAATAVLCLVAGSAYAEEAHIVYTGLDLSTPAGAALFKARTDAGARQLCGDYGRSLASLGARRECRDAVWEEAQARLPAAQRSALQAGQRPATAVRSARR